jgi:hypothetical protein
MEPTVEAGVGEGTTPELAPVVQIDEGRIQANLDHVLCVTVEETLYALLDGGHSKRFGITKTELLSHQASDRRMHHERRFPLRMREKKT